MYYSKKIVDLLIKRKGYKRAQKYLTYKKERSEFLKPLFKHLNKTKKNLKVLEIGCSAGHITEWLNEQPCIKEIYTYDIDTAFVEITKLKKTELNLHKIKQINHFTNLETQDLPYPDEHFDLIIVLAIVEHLPCKNRHLYVDQYYQKLKTGGLIGFFDTPNRDFFWETHSFGLPFMAKLKPSVAYIYAKLFGKLKGTNFPLFVRPGTGWRNSSYYELLPQSLMIDIDDISNDFGYGYHFFINYAKGIKNKLARPLFYLAKLWAQITGLPESFYLSYLNVIFKKTKNYESD